MPPSRTNSGNRLRTPSQSSQSLRTINSVPEVVRNANYQQLTYICFTINNPEEHGVTNEDILDIPDFVKYVVFQLEEGANGTPHFQGYAELHKRKSIGAIKNEWLGSAAHIEKMMSTRVKAREYAMKEETRVEGPWEAGEWVEGAGQGKRSDLDKACEIVRLEGLKAVVEKMPATYALRFNGLREYARAIQEPERDDGFQPRVWQAQLLEVLSEEPDDRTIYWVTDGRGNTGKSRLTRHLVDNYEALVLSGKVNDMQHIFYKAHMMGNVPKVVVFDVTRASAEYSDHLYTMAENIKNGLFCSGKFDGGMCRFKPPHVVFFSNSTWNREKLSHDRVHEVNLQEIGQAGQLPADLGVA